MKRYLAAALLLASCSTLTFVGCTEESTQKTEQTTKTPDGSVKVTDEKTIEKTGDAKDSAAPKPADAPH